MMQKATACSKGMIDSSIIFLILGLMAWGGLYLRNAHVRSLLRLTD